MYYIDHHPKKLSSSLGLLANPEARRQSTTRDQRIRSPNSIAGPSGEQQSSEPLHVRGLLHSHPHETATSFFFHPAP
jgi:hypothetical protein